MCFRPCAIALLISFTTASLALGGELNPPGAPGPTPGPEPRIAISATNTPGNDSAYFRITEPGSYYLADNITVLGVFTRSGIVIEASNVTLDLNGFTLDGYTATIPPHLNYSVTGILASGSVDHITIRNGIVRDWGEIGLDLTGMLGGRVEDVTLVNMGGDGIRGGSNSVFHRCIATECDGNGFYVNTSCSLTSCTARDSGAHGFRTSWSCTLTGCTSENNTENGFDLWTANIIQGCTATSNDGDGISVTHHTIVAGNTCYSHMDSATAAGIRTKGGGNRIEGNTVCNNSRGISADTSGSLIVRNVAIANTTNYSIVAGNAVGPILAAANPLTSNSPWANFGL